MKHLSLVLAAFLALPLASLRSLLRTGARIAVLSVSLCPALMQDLSFAAGQRPNIIIFLVDDMGVMDTSVPFLTDAAGQPKRYPLNDYYRTPNMDRPGSPRRAAERTSRSARRPERDDQRRRAAS